MDFFKRKPQILSSMPHRRATDSPMHPQHPARLQKLAEDLYKRNAELAVKNKTLQLLRQLYQISILDPNPKEIAQKISSTVLDALNFEIVGIFAFSKASSSLSLLGYSLSDRTKKITGDSPFSSVAAPGSASYNRESLQPLHAEGAMIVKEGIADIWSIPAEKLKQLGEESHIKSTLIYPLSIESGVIGVFSISLNRQYSELSEFEQESLRNIVDVIAVALDRASLYQELKVTNESLAEANERLKTLDQAKSEFISLATHQIRSPLTAIKGYSSLILDGDYGQVSDDLKNVIKIIFDSCQNLVVIVNEFLDISRIEQGRMKYNREKFDILDLVKETIQELLPNVEHAGLSMELLYGKDEKYFVDADRVKMKQVISNLIDNSIKYTPHGGISVRVAKENGIVRVLVKDTGLGIDGKEMEKLFAKFIRAREAHKVNVTGTGLGLYIAKQMVEAQGGRIWAESEGVGKGTVFTVELKEGA